MLRLSSIVAIAAVSCFGQDSAAPRPAHPVVQTTVAEIADGRIPNMTLVRLTGVIADAYPDETDSNYIFLVLKDGPDTIYVGLKKSAPDTYARTVPLIGATVAITGGAYSYLANKRIRLGCSVVAIGLKAIEILKPAPDPYSVPELELLANISPDKVALLGRHRTTGRVIARWKPNAFLLRTQRSLGEASNMVVRIECISEELPACGATVDVVGFPETDNYNINLVRAIWRPNPDATPDYPPSAPTNLTAQAILTDDLGRRNVKQDLYGKTVRLGGVIRPFKVPMRSRFRNRIQREYDGDGDITLEVQALSVGDIAYIGMPGEAASEIGQEIKWHSPFRRTYIAYMSTGCFEYQSEPSALVAGGYEPMWQWFNARHALNLLTAAEDAMFELRPKVFPEDAGRGEPYPDFVDYPRVNIPQNR